MARPDGVLTGGRDPVGGEPGPLRAGRHRAELLAEVARRLDHLPTGASVLGACSGGPDSTALAFLVAEARPDLDLVLATVAHGLRGDDHDAAEAGLVARHATWLGAEAVELAVRVVAAGAGLEAAARDARYAALRAEARRRGSVAILLGHHAEDQAETVLLRLARGTGIDGLAAMRAVAGDLTRPLLRIRRADLAAFCAGEGLPFAQDPMNGDPRVRRVVVRREVLPAMAQVAGDPVGALGRLADLVAADADALASLAGQRVPVQRIGPCAVIERRALLTAPPALARRAVRGALTAVGGVTPTAADVEVVLQAGPGTRRTLRRGLRCEVRDAVCVIAPAVGPAPTPVEVARPGRTPWPAVGVAVHVVAADRPPGPGGDAGPARGAHQPRLALDGALSGAPPSGDPGLALPGAHPDRLGLWLPAGAAGLLLRAPRAGDRIRTRGGRRRLVAVLRDAGVPLLLRERWPVLADADGVRWVPGLTVDAGFLTEGRRTPGWAMTLRRGPVTGADGTADRSE